MLGNHGKKANRPGTKGDKNLTREPSPDTSPCHLKRKNEPPCKMAARFLMLLNVTRKRAEPHVHFELLERPHFYTGFNKLRPTGSLPDACDICEAYLIICWGSHMMICGNTMQRNRVTN